MTTMSRVVREPRQAPSASRLLAGPLALAAAGVLFVLYPVLRPYGDASPASAAGVFASGEWLVAHLSAVAGFVLVAAALLTLRDRIGGRLAAAALGTFTAGVALVLPYYGAEAFALHALGATVPDAAGLTVLADAVRTGPVQISLFGVGLVLLAVGAVLAAVAVGRSGARARWSGAVFALGFVLYLPQFYAAPGLRIAHGVLLGIGCLLLAAELRRR